MAKILFEILLRADHLLAANLRVQLRQQRMRTRVTGDHVIFVELAQLVPRHRIAPVRVLVRQHIDVVVLRERTLVWDRSADKSRNHPIPADKTIFFDQGRQDVEAVAIALEDRNDEARFRLIPFPGGEVLLHFVLTDRRKGATVLRELTLVLLNLGAGGVVKIYGSDQRVGCEGLFNGCCALGESGRCGRSCLRRAAVGEVAVRKHFDHLGNVGIGGVRMNVLPRLRRLSKIRGHRSIEWCDLRPSQGLIRH